MVAQEVVVDSAGIEKVEQPKRQRRSIAEKRKIVEQAMQPATSVAAVARQYGVNANLVHYWRNLYRQGRLGEKKNDSIRLLPVRISESAAPPVLEPEAALSPTTSVVPAPTVGNIYIEFPKIHLRIESGADAALLRVVLEALGR
jgi:transposase-like protein